MKNEIENLKKKIKTQKIVIGFFLFFLVILSVALVYLNNENPRHSTGDILNFRQAQPDLIVLKDVGTFRQDSHNHDQSKPQELGYKGIWYDSAVVSSYMLDTFPAIVARFKKNNLGITTDTSYKWVVGFYWMNEKNPDHTADTANRNAFFVIPTLVNKKTGEVKDYYDDLYGNGNIYHPKAHPKIGGGTDSNAYNAGHLWP